jgi:hypothetical protein
MISGRGVEAFKNPSEKLAPTKKIGHRKAKIRVSLASKNKMRVSPYL